MDNKARDSQLGQILSPEVVAQLDEAEKNVLFEEFANSELRVLASQPIETIKAQAGLRTTAENQRRMTHIQPEEYPIFKDWYLSISNSLHEIICSKCGALLGIELETKDDSMNSHHHQGKFVIPVGQNMYAYRPRLDGVMGYQCANNVKSETYDDWQQYEKDATAYAKAAEAANAEFNKELDAYNELSDKKKETAVVPVFTFDQEPPVAPEIPPMVPCGNDTRVSEIEAKVVSEEHLMTSTTKEDIVKVKQEMNATNYEPDVKQTKRGYKIESFELREVKS